MYARRIRARVEDIRALGSGVWLTVRVQGWPGASPGQFALLQAEPSSCFLPRPLSVAQEEEEGLISFLIAPVGTGTRELGSLAAGDPLWVTGPLGKGFPLPPAARSDDSRLVVVAGGVGAAPFPLLLQRLSSREGSAAGLSEVVVLLGFRDAEQAEGAAPVVDAAAILDGSGTSCRCVLATEDGSVGLRGIVTDLLANELRPRDVVAACGPWAMAEMIWHLCLSVERVSAWFSLETAMACGVGSCHGCVVRLGDGSLARVCVDGPVFNGQSIWGAPSRKRKIYGGEA